MAFKALAGVEIVGVIGSSTLAVVLAFRGYGVWALVFRSLCSSSLQTLLLWAFSSWRPARSVDRRAIAELWRFSSHLVGFSVLNYWARKADDVLIGRLLGSGPLGLYTRAYGLMLLPINEISGVFGRVMFPVLSSIKDDKPRAKAIYLRAIAAISLVTFPLMLVLLVASEPIVLTLYGEKWRPMVPTLQIYCVVGAFQSIATTVGWLYQSQGRTDWMLRWGVVASTLFVLGIAIGVYFGSIETVAIAYSAVNLLLAYPLFAVPGKLVGMRAWEVARAVRGSLGCALIGAGVAFVIARAATGHLAIPLLALGELGGGLGAALLAAYWFRVEAYREIRHLLASRKKGEPSPSPATVLDGSGGDLR